MLTCGCDQCAPHPHDRAQARQHQGSRVGPRQQRRVITGACGEAHKQHARYTASAAYSACSSVLEAGEEGMALNALWATTCALICSLLRCLNTVLRTRGRHGARGARAPPPPPPPRGCVLAPLPAGKPTIRANVLMTDDSSSPCPLSMPLLAAVPCTALIVCAMFLPLPPPPAAACLPLFDRPPHHRLGCPACPAQWSSPTRRTT